MITLMQSNAIFEGSFLSAFTYLYLFVVAPLCILIVLNVAWLSPMLQKHKRSKILERHAAERRFTKNRNSIKLAQRQLYTTITHVNSKGRK